MGDGGVGPSYGGVRSSGGGGGGDKTEPASNKMEGDNRDCRPLTSTPIAAHVCITPHTPRIFSEGCAKALGVLEG